MVGFVVVPADRRVGIVAWLGAIHDRSHFAGASVDNFDSGTVSEAVVVVSFAILRANWVKVSGTPAQVLRATFPVVGYLNILTIGLALASVRFVVDTADRRVN